MRKILTAALAALTIGGAVAATSTPANAEPHWRGGGGWHGGYGGWHHDGDGAGLALGAGLLGLAVGASLAPHYGYYDGYYGPPRGYYAGPAYGYGYGYYGGCRVHYHWDPYAGRYFPVEHCY